MAALTSDLVWLVEQQIQLPDGQTITALAPQLYVRVQDGDLHASGALISANRINLNLTNDLVNSGAIVARQSVAIGADNIRNLGGRILGQDIGLQAATDIDNIGGRPLAVLNAGRERLKPDGVILVKVPNFACLNRHIRGPRWCGFRWPDHVNYFTPATMTLLAEKAGLRVKRINFLDKNPFNDNMYAVLSRA